jgi:hypothetical protein
MKGAAAGLGKLISFLAPPILVLAISFAISWPLWSLANADKRAFTLVVGAAAGIALLVLSALAARRRLKARAFAAREAAPVAGAAAERESAEREAGEREREA